MLHHLGAFLIALGMPRQAIWAGMPRFLRRVFVSWPVRTAVDMIQHPAVAPVLFVGLIYLWLIPAFHTRVMLDADLYNIMNASMAVDGIFFWCLVLDFRPHPPARIGSDKRGLSGRCPRCLAYRLQSPGAGCRLTPEARSSRLVVKAHAHLAPACEMMPSVDKSKDVPPISLQVADAAHR